MLAPQEVSDKMPAGSLRSVDERHRWGPMRDWTTRYDVSTAFACGFSTRFCEWPHIVWPLWHEGHHKVPAPPLLLVLVPDASHAKMPSKIEVLQKPKFPTYMWEIWYMIYICFCKNVTSSLRNHTLSRTVQVTSPHGSFHVNIATRCSCRSLPYVFPFVHKNQWPN